MNKTEFLNSLEKHLNLLTKEERNKYVTYYDEMIEDYKENGFSEEEAIEKIGLPLNIANEIMNEHGTIHIKMPSFENKIINIILLILGFPIWGSLLLTLIMCILLIYIIIWCIPFTTGISALAFFATSIVSIIGAPFLMINTLAVGVIQLGLGIASIGITLILIYLTLVLSKKLISISKIFTIKLIGLFQRKVVRV